MLCPADPQNWLRTMFDRESVLQEESFKGRFLQPLKEISLLQNSKNPSNILSF